MKLGYKERLGVLIGGQIALLVGVAVFTYIPSLRAIDAAQNQLDALSQKQTELCKLLETSPNPDAEIQGMRAQIRQLENRIPPESRVNWISARIAELMSAHHLDLRSATDWGESGDKPAAALKRLQKRIVVRGTAENLQALLESVNQLPFAVIVEDLDVQRDEQWGSVSADIRLATFVLRAASPRTLASASMSLGASR